MLFWSICRFPPELRCNECRTPAHVYSWDCRGVTTYVQPWRSYAGCPSCTESNSRWHWWCSQSTHAAAQTTSPIQCRHVTVIRDGLLRSVSSTNYSVPCTRAKFGDWAFSVAGPVVWNSLPAAVCEADSLYSFKRKLKTHLFNPLFYWLTVCFYVFYKLL